MCVKWNELYIRGNDWRFRFGNSLLTGRRGVDVPGPLHPAM